MGAKKWRTTNNHGKSYSGKKLLWQKSQVKMHVQIDCDDRKDPYQRVILAKRDQQGDTKISTETATLASKEQAGDRG